MLSHCNDLQRNALDAMISEPNKTQDPMFVDDPMGNKQSVKGAGMVPNFVEKKVFLQYHLFYYTSRNLFPSITLNLLNVSVLGFRKSSQLSEPFEEGERE